MSERRRQIDTAHLSAVDRVYHHVRAINPDATIISADMGVGL
jgi:predicted GTPase